MNKTLILQKLDKLKAAFENDEIPRLHQHEVNPNLDKSSRENYLYFFLTCCLNFQRISPNTWRSALKTWSDLETQFVFFPKKVVGTKIEELRRALLKHKLALQPNKHIKIWLTISKTLHKHFSDDPRQIFQKCNFDAQKVLELVQSKMKKDFPYLSGPKLSNYFMFILLAYSDLQLKNTHLISIIPDTHIMQATGKLGLLNKAEINPKSTERVWANLLKDSKYSPIDFHSILWNWSRNHFKPEI